MIAAGLRAGIEIRDERLTEEEFRAQRKEVLAYWPTGQEAADLDANVAYLSALPEHKRFPGMLANARREGRIAVVPQLGHALPEEMVEHLQHVERAGADSFLVQCDAYTRKLRLDEAQKAIDASVRAGKSTMNGFPFVNYGVEGSRRLIESVDLPLYINGDNDEDGRLLTEVGFAAGFTNTALCGLRDALTHSKDYPADLRIRNAQYICRLAAWYTEAGIPIEVTNAGSAIGCVGATPGMGVAISVLESIGIANQGVKHLSLHHDAQGAFLQDLAAMNVHRDLVHRYLERFGHRDVKVSLIMYPWTGAWPRNEWAGGLLMGWLAGLAALAKADWVNTKTPREAFGIPLKESNAASVEITNYAFELFGRQAFPLGDEYEEERAMLESEAVSIVEACLGLGDGDSIEARVAGLEAGLIDAPYPSYDWTRRQVLTARDPDKGVRWLDPGAVPLSAEVAAYHRAKLEAKRGNGSPSEIDAMIDDIQHLARVPQKKGA